jgi:neuralized-like protein 4
LEYFILLTRDLGTAEVTGTEISHSKSCDSRLVDAAGVVSSSSQSVKTMTKTTLGQATNGTKPTPVELAILPAVLEFHENHGRNVHLGEGRRTAKRTASYNQGVVISSKPLAREQLFQVNYFQSNGKQPSVKSVHFETFLYTSYFCDVQVRIDSLSSRWVSSVMCGVTCQSPEKTHFPLTALGFKKKSWIICSDCVFYNGVKVRTVCHKSYNTTEGVAAKREKQ